MRFLAARQIEESMSGIFPNMQAFVFGSTVNGYGKSGCDLDLILHSIDQSEVMKTVLAINTRNQISCFTE